MAKVDCLSPEVCDRDIVIKKLGNPPLMWTTWETLPSVVQEAVDDKVDLTVQGAVG